MLAPARMGNDSAMSRSIGSVARALVGAVRLVVQPVLGTIAAAAAVLLGLYVTAVCTTGGQLVEDAAVMGSDAAHGDPEWAQTLLATLANDRAIVVAVAAPLVLGWLQRRLLVGAVIAVTVLAANLTTQILKAFVFVRPELVVNPEVGTGNSLPSGTVTFLLATALGVAAMLPVSRAWRPVVVGLPILAIAGGCATIALDWHRPADVLAGVLVVVAWFAIAQSALDRLSGTSRVRRSMGVRVAVAGAVVLLPLAVIGVVPGVAQGVAAQSIAVYVVSLLAVAAVSLLCLGMPSGFRVARGTGSLSEATTAMIIRVTPTPPTTGVVPRVRRSL